MTASPTLASRTARRLVVAACLVLSSVAGAQVAYSDARKPSAQELQGLDALLQARMAEDHLDLSSVTTSASRWRTSHARWELRAEVWSRAVPEPEGFCSANQYFFDREPTNSTWRPSLVDRPSHSVWLAAAPACKRPATPTGVSHAATGAQVALILRQTDSLRARAKTLFGERGCDGVLAHSRLVSIGMPTLPSDDPRNDSALGLWFNDVRTDAPANSVVVTATVDAHGVEPLATGCVMR
jgi:hypothetical protein